MYLPPALFKIRVLGGPVSYQGGGLGNRFKSANSNSWRLCVPQYDSTLQAFIERWGQISPFLPFHEIKCERKVQVDLPREERRGEDIRFGCIALPLLRCHDLFFRPKSSNVDSPPTCSFHPTLSKSCCSIAQPSDRQNSAGAHYM